MKMVGDLLEFNNVIAEASRRESGVNFVVLNTTMVRSAMPEPILCWFSGSSSRQLSKPGPAPVTGIPGIFQILKLNNIAKYSKISTIHQVPVC